MQARSPIHDADLMAHLTRYGNPALGELRAAGRTVVHQGPDGQLIELCERTVEIEHVTDEAGQRAIEITASDESIDRYRDVIVASGWKLENYARNPVILIDHSYTVASIVGRGEPRIKGKKLKLRITHDENEANANAVMVRRLVEEGWLRAVSVGFMPLKWEWIKSKDKNGDDVFTGGVRYLEQDLMETSWVAVPANANATLSARSDLFDTLSAGLNDGSIDHGTFTDLDCLMFKLVAAACEAGR